MLTLRLETEDWRETLSAMVVTAEAEAGVDNGMEIYDDLADALCCDVLRRLDDQGVEWERACQQSVGAFSIVQTGDEAEREAFMTALEEAREDLYPQVLATAKDAAQED